MVVMHLGGNLRSKFQEFAQRNDGKVEIESTAQKRLNAYYEKKRNCPATCHSRNG